MRHKFLVHPVAPPDSLPPSPFSSQVPAPAAGGTRGRRVLHLHLAQLHQGGLPRARRWFRKQPRRRRPPPSLPPRRRALPEPCRPAPQRPRPVELPGSSRRPHHQPSGRRTQAYRGQRQWRRATTTTTSAQATNRHRPCRPTDGRALLPPPARIADSQPHRRHRADDRVRRRWWLEQ